MQVNPDNCPPEIYVTWSDPKMTDLENSPLPIAQTIAPETARGKCIKVALIMDMHVHVYSILLAISIHPFSRTSISNCKSLYKIKLILIANVSTGKTEVE